jgi:hypothetical protein
VPFEEPPDGNAAARDPLGTVVDSGDKEIVLCGGTATSSRCAERGICSLLTSTMVRVAQRRARLILEAAGQA